MSSQNDITLRDIEKYSFEVIREYLFEYYLGNDVDYENIGEYLKTDHGQAFLHKNSKELFDQIMEVVNAYVDYMPVPDID